MICPSFPRFEYAYNLSRGVHRFRGSVISRAQDHGARVPALVRETAGKLHECTQNGYLCWTLSRENCSRVLRVSMSTDIYIYIYIYI